MVFEKPFKEKRYQENCLKTIRNDRKRCRLRGKTALNCTKWIDMVHVINHLVGTKVVDVMMVMIC